MSEKEDILVGMFAFEWILETIYKTAGRKKNGDKISPGHNFSLCQGEIMAKDPRKSHS